MAATATGLGRLLGEEDGAASAVTFLEGVL